jgi:drug/metabolite transporter (DMT)-like permease
MAIFLITSFTLIAFAANSILCRLALGGEAIDPVSFATLRLISGAVILLPLSRIVKEPGAKGGMKLHWRSGLALFVYAVAFSLAYVTLNAGIGALILFGAVQATMIAAGLKAGERLSWLQWIGFVTAITGISYLVSPGLAAPDPLGAVLMLSAGIAWGIYSIQGRGTIIPVSLTAANFTIAAPAAIFLALFTYPYMHLAPTGIILAVISGSITSGLGYVLWYRALPRISTTQAAIVQLQVPVLAAFGGVIFLSEMLTLRLVIASSLILGGVATAVLKGAVGGKSHETEPVINNRS